MLQQANQMDPEQPARLYPQAQARVAKATGPRCACCASIPKRRPMLQQAGCKPAFHLVAQNQMDREHVARMFPQALTRVATATGPRSTSCAFRRQHRPLLRQAQLVLRAPYDGATPIAPPPKSKSRDKPKEGPGRVVHAKKGGPQ
jgi:hypothetical protein